MSTEDSNEKVSFEDWATEVTTSTTDKVAGKYASRLTEAELVQLAKFGEWLESAGHTSGGAASYRSNVAQAKCAFLDGKPASELSSSVKSALRKFAEFLAS